MKRKKPKINRLRIPAAPPTEVHMDKKRYNRQETREFLRKVRRNPYKEDHNE